MRCGGRQLASAAWVCRSPPLFCAVRPLRNFPFRRAERRSFRAVKLTRDAARSGGGTDSGPRRSDLSRLSSFPRRQGMHVGLCSARVFASPMPRFAAPGKDRSVCSPRCWLFRKSFGSPRTLCRRTDSGGYFFSASNPRPYTPMTLPKVMKACGSDLLDHAEQDAGLVFPADDHDYLRRRFRVPALAVEQRDAAVHLAEDALGDLIVLRRDDQYLRRLPVAGHHRVDRVAEPRRPLRSRR